MAATKPSGEGAPGQGRSDTSFPSASILHDLSSRGTAGLRFVVSTGVEKPNPELRKFIRSHVMLGKNRGKTLPPRKREPKGVQEVSSPSSDASPASASGPDGVLVGPSASSHLILPVTVPRKFGSAVSTIRFADAVEPGTVEVVLQCESSPAIGVCYGNGSPNIKPVSSIAKQVLFPLETCILFEGRAEAWIAPLAVDPAYLHAMIFTSQYYFDAIVARKSSPVNQRTLPHFLKTLRLLRERFAHGDDQSRLSNTTAAAIMGLAGHAHWMGDSKSAKHHMKGLCKIVNLRGGVTTFRDNAKLLIEILRCDIGMALHSGSRPVFFNKPSSREPFPPYPDLTRLLKLRKPAATGSLHDSAMFFNDIDFELARAWRVMSGFCSVINFAVESGQRISTETFLDTMASVVYRLLDMHFEAGANDEAIRLGLLACSCSVFLQWKHLGMFYPHLTSAFRDCLAMLTSSHISSQLLLWLLMVGAVSVFDATDDGWLKPLLLVNIGLCEIDSWSKMQDLLKSFMWIGLLHDKPGKGVFELYNRLPGQYSA